MRAARGLDQAVAAVRGLVLSISHDIIEKENGGSIEVDT